MIRITFAVITLSLFLLPIKGFTQIDFQDRSSILGLSENTGYSLFGGAGVSYADFDNDGFDDITLATGDNEPIRFYKNIDGLFFSPIELLVTPENYYYKTRSVTWVDYDNDGDKDLFITSDTNGNRLLRRTSNFLEEVTIATGFPLDNLFTYGASWGDINNDGCLDVYLSNRIGNTIITNYLFQNNCDGTFSEVTDDVGLTNEPALSFCSGFFDFNNDGWQDLYVANDKFKPNYLYKNNGDGTFTDISELSGTDLVIDAMSVTIDDFNADGFFDIFITNTPENISTPQPGSVLLKNNGDETFTNIAATAGTELNSFSWGSSFLDADNNGKIDLYVNTQYTDIDTYPNYAFYKNNGDETFSDNVTAGFDTNNYRSYGCAIGDYNNDGRLEIAVNNDFYQVPSLWENTAINTRNYIAVSLVGIISNADGIGSVIEISIDNVKQYRIVMGGEGYLSQNSYTEHFGIDTAANIDYIKVKWLSGIEDIISNVSPNQKVTIVEGASLSMDDFGNVDKLSIYPNPCKEMVRLKSKHNISSVTLFDELGRQIISNANINNQDVEINTELLSKGIYIIKTTTDGLTYTSKIIKE